MLLMRLWYSQKLICHLQKLSLGVRKLDIFCFAIIAYQFQFHILALAMRIHYEYIVICADADVARRSREQSRVSALLGKYQFTPA